MTIETLNAVIVILTIIILVLICFVFKQNIQFYSEKEAFKIKLSVLQDIIVEISKKQLSQQDQIKLSEELEKSLKSNKTKLNGAIFGLNYDLFEIVTNNNLI